MDDDIVTVLLGRNRVDGGGDVEVDGTRRSNARSPSVKTYAEEEAMVSPVNRAFLGALVANVVRLGFLLFFSFTTVAAVVVVGGAVAVLVVGDGVIAAVPVMLVGNGVTAAGGGGVTSVVLVLVVVTIIGLAD